MYRDIALLRQHQVKVRFNESEDAVFEVLANFTGSQKAVLVRELALEQARRIASGQYDIHETNEGTMETLAND